jgi:hypothetical protein
MAKRREDKGQVQFGKTPEEVVRDRKAKMDHLKQPRQPLGGAPQVSIPPLNAEPIPGQTMDQQAAELADPTNPMSPHYNPELQKVMQPKPGAPSVPVGHGFQPVPPGAEEMPGFRPGVGSAYMGNQPNLRVPPGAQQPGAPSSDGPYKPKISPETMAEMNRVAATSDDAVKAFANEAASTQGKEVQREKEERERRMEEDFRRMLNDDETWDRLNNPERRVRIEKGLSPLDITDLILHGECRQDVPINDRVTYSFRTVTGKEDLAVKRMMFGEKGGDRYLMDKYTLMQLTLAFVGLNGEELPTHLDKDGEVDKAKFDDKFDKVLRFPLQLLADCGIQYMWFHDRVKSLFDDSDEELKNG